MTSELKIVPVVCTAGYTPSIVHDWWWIIWSNRDVDILDDAEKVSLTSFAETFVTKISKCTTRNPFWEKFDEMTFRFEEMFIFEDNSTSLVKKLPKEQINEDFREVNILFEGKM